MDFSFSLKRSTHTISGLTLPFMGARWLLTVLGWIVTT